MNLKQFLLIFFLILGTVILSLWIYESNFKQKAAYIDIKKVFNGFLMKKELEEKFKQTKQARQKIIDSLSFNLKLMSKQLNEEKNAKKEPDKEHVYAFEYKREEYFKLKKQLEEDNAVLSQKYDSQILEQMTQYVIEYGKKHHYDFIYGTDGSGNLMYSNDKYNLSEEIIQFINNKYKGSE